MKKWADKEPQTLRLETLFKVMPTRFRSQTKLHKGLVSRYEAPFEIIRTVEKVPFEFKLPRSMRVHPVFHASMHKPYHDDSSDSADAGSSCPLMTETPSLKREIIEILDHRTVHRPRAKAYTEFLVRLSGQAQQAQLGSSTKTWPDIRTLSRSISKPR